jgi:hypothetical protein
MLFMNKPISKKLEVLVQIAMVCSIFSIVFVLMSTWISGESTNLLKMSAPVSILILSMLIRHKAKRARTDGL